jgi:hypothetical protein
LPSASPGRAARALPQARPWDRTLQDLNDAPQRARLPSAQGWPAQAARAGEGDRPMCPLPAAGPSYAALAALHTVPPAQCKRTSQLTAHPVTGRRRASLVDGSVCASTWYQSRNSDNPGDSTGHSGIEDHTPAELICLQDRVEWPPVWEMSGSNPCRLAGESKSAHCGAGDGGHPGNAPANPTWRTFHELQRVKSARYGFGRSR